ncbi:hypothetical protein SGLAM104S_04012 [Streptomyces glaucescens]
MILLGKLLTHRGQPPPLGARPRGHRPCPLTTGERRPCRAWCPTALDTAAFRNHVIDGGGGNKHIWTVRMKDLRRQRDLSAVNCPGDCKVIDDSPAFSPDGRSIVFNRENGGGRIDERNGLLLTSLSGNTCQVLLPVAARDLPGACRRELPDTSLTGPHQPRDAAWTADGTGLVFSARHRRAVNSPEKLKYLHIASGDLIALTGNLPGRQKEPSVQQSVDLAVRAPGSTDGVTVGRSTTVRVDVVNNGPAASPGTQLTVAPPAGVRITRLNLARGQLRRRLPPVRRRRGAARYDRSGGRHAHRGHPR